MDELAIKALKTLSGGLFYTLYRYHKRDLDDEADFQKISEWLKMDPLKPFCVELNPNGFVITTKRMVFRYKHSDFSNKYREIELRY